MTTTPTSGAADLPEALRVPLDSLHADAGYLCGRLLNGSMTQEQVVATIRRRIDAAKVAALAAGQAVAPHQWDTGYPPLPDPGINTASHAHFRVIGYTEAQMCAYVDADRAARPAPPAMDGGEDAERYRWLRNPTTDVALVLDKRTAWVPPDDVAPGVGGYWVYEYRAGDELDAAIDAARAAQKEKPNG